MPSPLATTLGALLLASANSWAGVAEAPNRTMPHRDECAVPLPTDFWDALPAKGFRAAEAWAWNERICLGRRADMRFAPGGRGDGEECAPAETEKRGQAVPVYRELSPDFLELILSHEPWASAPRHPKVDIRCALVRGDVVLDDHDVAPSFGFFEGTIDGRVSLIGTRFKRTLSLARSTLTGTLHGDRLEVGGGLLLRDGTLLADVRLPVARIAGTADLSGSAVAGQVRVRNVQVGGDLLLHDDSTFGGIELLGAKIGGNVQLTGATITGSLAGDGMTVGGELFLRKGTTVGDVRLIGATIGGGADLSDSSVAGTLNAENLELGRDLFLHGESRFEDIVLTGAAIAGGAYLDGSVVTGSIGASGLDVGGDVFLRNGGAFAAISMIGAGIGGGVHLAGGVFSGPFDLTGATVGGELHLSSAMQQRLPTWHSGSSLILRNARAHALQAQRESWKVSGGEGLVPTDLTGFTFHRLGGLDSSGGPSMADESSEWLIGWIEAQRDHGVYYDPQPYMQLAHVLSTAGATEKADAIRYAKFDHRYDHDTSIGLGSRVSLLLLRGFVGYGVYPFRALYWFLALVLIGGLLAQWSNDSSVRGWTGLWYSLENALPLIGISERFKFVEHGRPYFVHIFHFQKAFGFVLATVLVGGLTLLAA